jgi:hypothetical protein
MGKFLQGHIIMNISGSILILIIIYVLYNFSQGNDFGLGMLGLGLEQMGGKLPQMNIQNKYDDPYYNRQYRELDDVDNVLNRPLHATVKAIRNLKASNKYLHNETQLSVPDKVFFDFAAADVVTKDTSEAVKVLVENKQPYFLDEALIIDKDGKKFYWDTRYPKQPISVEFAKDPVKYVRTRPNEYPSYVVASRNYGDIVDVDLLM